jgi:hypothetical protein
MNTVYFAGMYSVLLSGLISDTYVSNFNQNKFALFFHIVLHLRFGRKKAIYGYLVANALVHILMAFVVNTDSVGLSAKQILYTILRTASGVTCHV